MGTTPHGGGTYQPRIGCSRLLIAPPLGPEHCKRQTIRRVGGNGRIDYLVRAAQAAGVSPANF